MNALEFLATYKARLKVARGELVTVKASVLPYVENQDNANQERSALATIARGIATVSGVLIRIIDSLPGSESGGSG